MSTRRIDQASGSLTFDHGAQFVTARDPRFAAALQAMAGTGHTAVWAARFAEAGPDGSLAPAGNVQPRWVGMPGMNALVRGLLADHEVSWSVRIVGIAGTPGAWTLSDEQGARHGPFSAVAVCVPAEQVGALLAPQAQGLADKADAAGSAPCWAVMGLGAAGLDWDAVRFPLGPLGWAARETSKPGRSGPERWVLHGAPDWSRDHLEAAPSQVQTALVDAFRAIAPDAALEVVAVHRWRFAQVETAAGAAFGLDAARLIGAAGDWWIGPRVEAAWQSGTALGEAMAAALQDVHRA